MKHKLSEIINTDCYIQFDSNEQLREWVKKAGIRLCGYIDDLDVYIRFYSDEMPYPLEFPVLTHPIHHHTNIEI
jgi:hypothetical protein